MVRPAAPRARTGMAIARRRGRALTCRAFQGTLRGMLFNGDPMTTAPALEFAFELRAEVGPALESGDTGGSRRRIVAITGGTFAGPQLRGRVLPGGADWQLVQPDGLARLDTRYTIETD